MNKEKQIEEMADVLERAKVNACATIGSMNSSFGMWYATALYTEGYRKQSEGEWVVTYKHGFWHYDCPFCGDGYAQEGKLPISNYCSNCGAKMKGGE